MTWSSPRGRPKQTFEEDDPYAAGWEDGLYFALTTLKMDAERLRPDQAKLVYAMCDRVAAVFPRTPAYR